MNVNEININQLIGKGYKDYWNFKGRYRAVKGSRGSKKSTTAFIELPYKMMKYWHMYGIPVNALVIRRFYNTHSNSTYAQLLKGINMLGVRHLWKATKSPLMLEYMPSKTKIIFRGMDDPLSLTSLTVENGYLPWVIWEEAFQIENEEDFNKVDMSIRGEIPNLLYKQHTLIFNPWSDRHWLKNRFFDVVGENGLSEDGITFAKTKNYNINEFLGEDDIMIFEKMKKENPRRYSIEGLGEWGIADGLVYENWEVKEFNISEIMIKSSMYDTKRRIDRLGGLDFGFINDPTAILDIYIDKQNGIIYINNETCEKGLTNQQIKDAIWRMNLQNIVISADTERRTINELQILGVKIKPSKKGAIIDGIQKLQDYKFIVHPRCTETIKELSLYCFKTEKNTNKILNDPIDEFNHCMDALRYATHEVPTRFEFIR